MPDWLIEVIKAIIPGIVVGIVMAYWNKKEDKKAKDAAEKELDTRRKNKLELSLLIATAELSYAIAMAIKRGSPNGEVDSAKESCEKALKELRAYEQEKMSAVN